MHSHERRTGSAPSTPAAAAKGAGEEKDDAAPAKKATPSSLPASTSRGSASKTPPPHVANQSGTGIVGIIIAETQGRQRQRRRRQWRQWGVGGRLLGGFVEINPGKEKQLSFEKQGQFRHLHPCDQHGQSQQRDARAREKDEAVVVEAEKGK